MWHAPGMATLSVVREVQIDATPEAVWTVLATPQLQPILEPSARLIEEAGDTGMLGSTYDLKIHGRRLQYRVEGSEFGKTYAVSIAVGGRPVSAQVGTIRPDGAGCSLTWTVQTEVPLLLRPLARATCNKELPRWLSAVARRAGN